MNAKQLGRNCGFTLVELLVVMVMMGLVSTAMFSVYQDTNRTSHTEEDVVELQQTLRVTLDQIADDIRMAGFLVSADYSPLISATVANDTDGVPRPRLAFRTGSAYGQVMRLAPDDPADLSNPILFSGDPDDTVVAADERSFKIASADQLRLFDTGQCVRVYRPALANQPLTNAGTPYLFRVTTVAPSTGTVHLKAENFGAVEGDFSPGDIVARVFGAGSGASAPCGATIATETPAGLFPEFVYYQIVLINNMPSNAGVNPPLARAIRIRRQPGYCKTGVCSTFVANAAGITETVDIGTPFTSAPAPAAALDTLLPNVPRVTTLNFGYILRNGTEVASISDTAYGFSATSPLRKVVAIRVTIGGQTSTGKTRVLSTVVPLKNRDYEAVKETTP